MKWNIILRLVRDPGVEKISRWCQDKASVKHAYSSYLYLKMNVTVSNTRFNAPGVCIFPRRRVLVTPKAMSENGVSARNKTTVHKLVEYFGAITVPGMYISLYK
jgi:hypothetical protein